MSKRTQAMGGRLAIGDITWFDVPISEMTPDELRKAIGDIEGLHYRYSLVTDVGPIELECPQYPLLQRELQSRGY